MLYGLAFFEVVYLGVAEYRGPGQNENLAVGASTTTNSIRAPHSLYREAPHPARNGAIVSCDSSIPQHDFGHYCHLLRNPFSFESSITIRNYEKYCCLITGQTRIQIIFRPIYYYRTVPYSLNRL